MIELANKKLLVLGGTSASLALVQEAQRLGVYAIVVDDNESGVAKDIADESFVLSTTDFDGLLKLIKEKEIDGVFCGPSEFNIKNTMKICKMANLPFYISEEQWDMSSDKATFKVLCDQYGVPTVPGYNLTEEFLREDLEKIEFPVIVKPVDGSSSVGLTVCWNEEELKRAVPIALENSESKRFIVEKYITNDHGFGCKYIANDGEIYLTGLSDRYTVGEGDGKAMIINVAVYPSKLSDYYIKEINTNAIKMFKAMGIQNGTFFMQALVDHDGKTYFHEMGLRLSGGFSFKMFEITCGFSDMEMMIRYALGEQFATEEEIKKINPYFNGHYVGILCLPLKRGKLKEISGVTEVLNDPTVFDYIQYYHENDEIGPEKMGSLMQLFCRVKILTENKQEFIEKMKWIQETLSITGENNEDMIYRYFDTERLS